MLGFTFLCQIVICGTIIQIVRSEECIQWKKHNRELENCCKWDPPFPREAISQCSQLAADQVSNDNEESLRCIFECYFERLGIVVDETLNVEKLSEYLQSMSEDVRNHVIATYKKCAAQTTGTMRVCNSYAQELELCALNEMARYCPDELYTPSEICDKWRSGVDFCES